MENWSLFLTYLGAAAFTAQLFRLVNLIEQPPKQRRISKRLRGLLRSLPWTFWKN